MNGTMLCRVLDARPPSRFETRLAWEAAVTVGARVDLGDGPLGRRFMVPITGGVFRGGPNHPELQGTVLAGGADRQLLRRDGVKELEASYEMRTHDGAVLQIRNEVIVDRPDSPERYAVSRIRVSAPDGPWAWLNRRFFLGGLQSGRPDGDFVIVRGWEVLPA
ncbi:MAG: hypothetical protein Tsb0019_00720 [Roseibium sp.]